MSTRASLVYSEIGIHVYHELLDDTVHIEIERPYFNFDFTLCTYDDWVESGCPISVLRF